MNRALPAAAAVLVAAVAGYWFLLRDGAAEPTLLTPRPVAVIGSGSAAVGVSGSGAVLDWQAVPDGKSLPRLPLSTAPGKPHLAGTLLQQARVLGAAPVPLLARVERSFYGEGGVDVVLRSGIELRFGDASQARRKWAAAAAVLASPSTSALDYVDLAAPSRPAVYGFEHVLPPAP